MFDFWHRFGIRAQQHAALSFWTISHRQTRQLPGACGAGRVDEAVALPSSLTTDQASPFWHHRVKKSRLSLSVQEREHTLACTHKMPATNVHFQRTKRPRTAPVPDFQILASVLLRSLAGWLAGWLARVICRLPPPPLSSTCEKMGGGDSRPDFLPSDSQNGTRLPKKMKKKKNYSQVRLRTPGCFFRRGEKERA